MSSTSAPNSDYRATLNLPATAFPMQAELPKREPGRVAWWREHGVYERRLAANAANPTWILHDGPPYANGEVHMGTFLNRVLKDVFVKVHLLDGRRATFVPGWDMHGLPIEFETLKHLKLDFRKIDPIELRARCRERALYWLDRQRATFLRMGVLGDYDHPYRTVDKHFEAEIVETLADLAEAEQLYKGLRATLWCVRDETALAEAEIEYKPRVSPSIYVRFAATPAQRMDLLERFGLAGSASVPERVSIAIWTTTPWTLPANVAIAVKPEARYGLYVFGDEAIVVADALAGAFVATAPSLAAALGDVPLEGARLASVRGEALIGAATRHPFLDRDSAVVGAAYVELDTGTGAVHTAPGHGADDFDTGLRYGLPTLVPVDATGHFTQGAGPYAGLQIFEANPLIVEDLRASGALIHASEYEHSYPHCWRCKNPVIFRATSQWFIAMDVNRLRKRAEEKLPAISWVPPWGEERMRTMLENHPEWCVSRQRTWGTPIPAVQCRACRATILDPEVARRAAGLFREGGADLWWTEPVSTFLPESFACENCSGREFEKEFNIVDIWFESGVTHRVVLGGDGLPWPADVVLEGADQFRGWFRSSLLTGVATKGAAPYREVVVTGWVVDKDGHAMHKSAGNYLAAEDAMHEYGADVLRLWIASVEFAADMRLGKELLKSIQQVYRNFRNRLRWMLGTIADLTPERIAPEAELAPIDALALARFRDLARTVVGHYERYRLHDVYLALIAFDGEDLSRFFVDVLKDPTYSTERDGPRRRSAQTTVFRLLEGLLALYAPLLSFTAEEAWQGVPEALRAGRASVFDLTLPRPAAASAADLALWETLKSLRGVVSAAEGMRDFQLAAHVRAGSRELPALRALGDGLREALVVSQLSLEAGEASAAAHVTLSPAPGEKCGRCWKWLPRSEDPRHPTLCAPCARIVTAIDEGSAAADERAGPDPGYNTA